MAYPGPYTKRRSPPSFDRGSPPASAAQPPSRSSCTSRFLCKSVFFALFIVSLPLFPSQAPDFVGETVLTKFWELIHLLFVGIAVSYGIFSRRNVDSPLRTSNVDESSLSYLSRMFHVSSFFDYESEFDERNENRSTKVSIPTSVHDEENKSGSFVVESQTEDSLEYGKINQVQAWNSQYFRGRSNVVVAQPSYGLDDYVGHKPLDLPVRSLRSALRDTQAPEACCLSGNNDGAVRGYLGSFGSVELEEKFDEVRAPSSPVPRHSRSEKVAVKDNWRGGTYRSHFTPLPVDEPQFENLKSGSFRSTSSSSSHASFVSHTQSRFSPSHSASAASLNLNMEELDKEHSLQGSSRSSSPSLSASPSPSPPSPKSVSDDTYRHMLHSRHFSEGSLFEEDGIRGFEEDLNGGTLRCRRTDFLNRKELGSRSLKLNGEDFRKGSSSRKSYPPDHASPPLGGEDFPSEWSPQEKSCDLLFEDTVGKSREEDPNHLRGELRSNSQKRIGKNLYSLELGAEDCDKDASPPQSAPSPLMSTKASSHSMEARLGGRGSFLDKDAKRNSEDDSIDFGWSGGRDLPGIKLLKADTSLRWESNSGEAADKVSLRGKSVRTGRPGWYAKDQNVDGESSDDWAEAEGEHQERTKLISQREDEASKETSQEKLGHTRGMSKPRYHEEQNGRSKQCSKSHTMMHDGDDLEPEETEAEQPQVSIEEESAQGRVSDAGTDPNEVDRKAGEFIAKFREQIRLQKLSSGELPRGIGDIPCSRFR